MAFSQTLTPPEKDLLLACARNAVLQMIDDFLIVARVEVIKCQISPEFKM
jgi:hypothetical protein